MEIYQSNSSSYEHLKRILVSGHPPETLNEQLIHTLKRSLQSSKPFKRKISSILILYLSSLSKLNFEILLEKKLIINYEGYLCVSLNSKRHSEPIEEIIKGLKKDPNLFKNEIRSNRFIVKFTYKRGNGKPKFLTITELRHFANRDYLEKIPDPIESVIWYFNKDLKSQYKSLEFIDQKNLARLEKISKMKIRVNGLRKRRRRSTALARSMVEPEIKIKRRKFRSLTLPPRSTSVGLPSKTAGQRPQRGKSERFIMKIKKRRAKTPDLSSQRKQPRTKSERRKKSLFRINLRKNSSQEKERVLNKGVSLFKKDKASPERYEHVLNKDVNIAKSEQKNKKKNRFFNRKISVNKSRNVSHEEDTTLETRLNDSSDKESKSTPGKNVPFFFMRKKKKRKVRFIGGED